MIHRYAETWLWLNGNCAVGKVLEGHRPEADLQISIVFFRPAFYERGYLGRAQCEIALAGHQVTEPFPILAYPGQVGVVGTVRRATETSVYVEMILQVLADAWNVLHHRDGVLLQLCRGPHTRQHQQLRGFEGAGRHNDLARRIDALATSVTQNLDSDRCMPLEQHTLDFAPGAHGKVLALDHRLDERAICRKPAAVTNVVLHETNTVVQCAVHIFGIGYALPGSRLDKVVATLLLDHRIADPQWPTCAAVIVAATLETLHFLEVRQYIIIAPARIAKVAPAVKILLMPPNKHHAIDRTGPPEQFSPWPIHLSVTQVRHGCGMEVPVQLFIEIKFGHPGGGIDPEPIGRRASFQKQHIIVRVVTQATCQRAP
ncbi:hypothetical protein D3C78_949790 [compost metagenome]